MLHPFGKAVYIKATERAPDFSLYDPAPRMRRVLTLTEDVHEATLHVQCPSYGAFYINGQSVTEDLFISATSDYSHILWYNSYDVTSLLQKGDNAVCAILGNGFFNESFETPWEYEKAPWRDAPQMLLCLTVNGVPMLISDSTWRTDREGSPIIFTHLRSGEHYDARRRDDAWLYADYNDSSWAHVFERSVPEGARLLKTPCPAVRCAEKIPPVCIKETDEGYLVDFGVTSSGYIEAVIKAERGDEITFTYAEEVDENLHPTYHYNGVRDARSLYPQCPYHTDKLIASGERDTFRPMFTYHGFRYVIISGMREAPKQSDLFACFLHQDVCRTSAFSCGNAILNYIYEGGIRSTYSNMFWCLTDCPTREKLGWANDAQASLQQTLINFDIAPLYEKWFEDIKAAMREDGALPGIIPSSGWGYIYGPVCDGLLFELPYRVYLYTGNKRFLQEGIPYFERYISFLREKRRQNYEFSLADWTGTGNIEGVSRAFVQEFCLLKAYHVTLFAYRVLKQKNRVLEQAYEDARARFIETYLAEDGTCIMDKQPALSMMLELGLYHDRAPLSRQLQDIVRRDKYKLGCGMVGTQYLYHALAHIGCAEDAYRIITESEPGYKTWYDHGATTLWECLDGTTLGSHNHHMFSGVIAWFYTSLLGIAPNEEHPAFEEVVLKPCFIRDLGHAEGWFDTVRGRIGASWERVDGGYRYTVSVPSDIHAFFRGEAVGTGEHTFFVSDGEDVL